MSEANLRDYLASVFTNIEPLLYMEKGVPNSEVDLCTPLYVVGTAGSVLIREVALIQSVLYREAPLCRHMMTNAVTHSASIIFMLVHRYIKIAVYFLNPLFLSFPPVGVLGDILQVSVPGLMLRS